MMRKIFILLAPLAAVAVSFANVATASDRPNTLILIKAAHLLDPRAGNILSPAAVLVEDTKIKEVGSPQQLQPHVPANTKTIDLGNATLLPGLIDSHTHLFLDIIVPPEAEQQRHNNPWFSPGLLLAIVESPSKRALVGAQSAREDLESGFTTVRNLGHSGVDGDTELRNAINAGRVPGPRILASGRKLITRGSYLQNLNPVLADKIVEQEFLIIAGIDEAREAVRRNAFQGVDVIKVTADENLTVPELSAVTEEAHREHLKVAVHAPDKISIQTAIDSHADSIEHGNEVTDEQLKQMRDRGIFIGLTPTFYDDFYLKIAEPNIVISPAAREKAASRKAARKQEYDQLVGRVLKSAVKFAAGSDMCWFYNGKTRGQASVGALVKLRDARMPPIDVIRSITTNAAEMLGWSDRVGTIEAGKFADLVATTGDPIADITELERIHFVMKNGTIVRNDTVSH